MSAKERGQSYAMAKGKYQKWLERDNLILLQGWKRDGATDEQIAKMIGINPVTLYDWIKKYPKISKALKSGKETTNFVIENALLKKALDGNTTAMIFWLKNNWRDKYNDSQLSTEEREVLKQKLRKAKADADLAEYQTAQIINSENKVTSAVIVDDIEEIEEDHE